MTTNSASKTVHGVIIGIGSPFGDDRLGWDVVNWLQQHPQSIPIECAEFPVIALDRPGAALITYLQGKQVAIIIDALRAGLPLGCLRIYTAEELMDSNQPVSSHGFGLRETLTLAQALDKLPPYLYVIGMEIGNTEVPRNTPQEIAWLGITSCNQLNHVVDELKVGEIELKGVKD